MIEEQIKPSELRIGNIICKDVSSNGGNYLSPCVVTNIDRGFVALDEWDVYQNHNETQYKGLPLTEEWLVKFGFESDCYQDRYLKGEFIIHCDKTRGFLELWESKTSVLINTVHQLQNLYFALTNEELKITE